MTRRAGVRAAFTIIELIVVMAVILVLAGLVLSVSSYAQEKGRRSRAEAEIAAMSAALESYKADNGIYPLYPANSSDALTPSGTNAPDLVKYAAASLYLFKALSGQDEKQQPVSGAKSYFGFKSNQLSLDPSSGDVQSVRDPFGITYGYSTEQATLGTGGYNPTFDLWSTGGETGASKSKWIKNW